MNFFYPPQPSRIWPQSSFFQQLSDDAKWIAEIKYNGWRLLIFKENNQLKFYNRHGTIIDIDVKPFQPLFESIPDNSIYDGELVDRRTKDLKNIIVLWDAPFYANKDLRNNSLIERRKYMKFDIAPLTFKSSHPQIYQTQHFSSNFIELYDTVVKRNNDVEEGLVLKRLDSKYEWHQRRGVDTLSWVKVKKIGNHAMVSQQNQ